MQTITVGFSKSIGFKPFSWAIRLVQRTDFSHVYIRKRSKAYDAEYVYQASGSQVNFTNIDTFLEHNTVIEEYEIDISDEAMVKLMHFAISNAGKSYSIKQISGIALRCLGWDLPQLHDDKGFICSELVGIIIDDILGVIDLPCDKDYLTPKDVYQVVSNSPIFRKVLQVA